MGDRSYFFKQTRSWNIMQTINNDKNRSFIFKVFVTIKTGREILFDLLVVKFQAFTCIWYGDIVCFRNRINKKIEGFNIDKSFFRVKQFKDSLPFIGSLEQHIDEFKRQAVMCRRVSYRVHINIFRVKQYNWSRKLSHSYHVYCNSFNWQKAVHLW